MAYKDSPEYVSLYDKTQGLANKLYGPKGYGIGLDSDVLRILQSKGKNSPEYKKIKQRFDALEQEYTASKQKLETLKDKLDAPGKKVKTDKEIAAIDKEIKVLENSLDAAVAINKSKQEIDKIKNDIEVLKAEKTNVPLKDKVDETNSSGPNVNASDTVSVENLFANASITGDGKVVTYSYPSELDSSGKPTTETSILFFQPSVGARVGTTETKFGPQKVKGNAEESQVNFFRTDQARDLYQKQLEDLYGSKQGLINKLYNAGYLKTNKNVTTVEMLGALQTAAQYYTVKQTDIYKTTPGGVKEFESMDAFLTNTRNPGLETVVTKRPVIYGQTDTNAIANKVMQALKGRDATPGELLLLKPLLNTAQQKNPEVTSTTRDIEGNTKLVKTNTGLNPEQFLIEEISKSDEAKAYKVLNYYDAFKQVIGVM